MPPLKNLVGQKFNRLTVLSRADNKGKKVYWNCECECGNICTIRGFNLTSNKTKSCGCYNTDKIKERMTTCSGMTNTPEWTAYHGMKDRCYNKNRKGYHRYGGRGITVCNRWLDSFNNFYEDMGNRPSDNHSLDRINNDKGYCKDNCRWADIDTQNNNLSTNVLFEINGEVLTITEGWKKYVPHLKRQQVCDRYYRGFTTNDIFEL